MLKRRLLIVIVASLVAGVAIAGCSLFQNRPPVAAFVPIYNVDAEDPMVAILDASLSTDPDSDAITLFQWAFSDAIEFPVEPQGATTTVDQPRLRIRCPVQGTYTATLVVVDERGMASLPVEGTISVPQP